MRLLVLSGLVLVAACGGSKRENRPAKTAAACGATVEEAVSLATAAYIKDAKPKPERFLVAVGTDSALGDAGMSVLQGRGPTYLFPGDPALQAQVRSQLHEKGDYTTLLVVRGGAEAKDGRASVRLNGHYVGGEENGQSPGPRAFAFSCDTTGWRLSTSAPERSS